MKKKQRQRMKLAKNKTQSLKTKKKSQAQNFDKVTTSQFTRQRKSITRTQSSTAFASFKKLKKKRNINNFENSNNKRQKRFITANMKKFNRKNIFIFFQQTTLISKNFHQSKDIYEIFSKRCSIDDFATILLLTRFFFDIENSNSFDQFNKIYTTLRQNQNLSTLQTNNSLRQVIQILNSLNVQFFVASIIQRYFLVSLKTHKMKLKKKHQHSLSVRTKKISKQLITVSIFDRVDTQTLKKMMKKTYSNLQLTRKTRDNAMNEY